MSLKNCVIFLLLINLAYFGYGEGWFHAFTGDDQQHEPERMTKQVNPQAIEVTIASPVALQVAAPSAPTPEPAPPAEPACVDKKEQWLVYMGSYATKALLEKKKAELRALGITSSYISKPTLKFGLSLGQYESETTAREALAGFAKRGVRTANVVLWAIQDCPH